MALGLAASGCIGTSQAGGDISLLNAFTFADGAKQGGVEILGYTPDLFTVAGTYVSDPDGTLSGPAAFGVQVLTLGSTGSLTERFQIDLNSSNTGLTLGGVSSVALDPNSRRFGAATVIPADSTGTPGKVAFFNYDTGSVIGAIDVGFHPDHIRFSADGTRLYVANEGEFRSGATQAPGSISIIDISDVNAGNLANLAGKTAATYDFSAPNLGASASLSGIRNPNAAAVGTAGAFIGSVPDFTLASNQDAGAIEPEYITVSGGKAYVSLQDNNAIGVFDLGTSLWEKVNNLGAITQTIDASDQDSGGTASDDTVKGLPMPDTIASYVVAGKTYLVTANEGDARTDDRDISRFGDIAGADSMNPILDLAVYPGTQTGVRANSNLGRLNVSRLDGDNGANGGVAGDGKVDDVTMIGTRSYTIWEVQSDSSLVLQYDSGSLEPLLLSLDLPAHNMNRGDTAATDTRSDDKGPEPEGLTLWQQGGETMLALALERQNGLLLFDISDPAAPVYRDYINTYTGGEDDRLVSPEGMLYISAVDSPTGTPLLLVGYEGHDGGANNRIIEGGIGVFQLRTEVELVPEPGTALAGVALLGVGFVMGWRQRR